MDAAPTSRLLGLPEEMTVHIASFLDKESLGSFRLASKQLSRLGFRRVHEGVPEVIDATSHRHSNVSTTTLVKSIVVDVQDNMPRAAAKVVELKMQYSNAREKLPTSFSAINLPRLKTLRLQNVSVQKSFLKAMLETHSHSLESIDLNDTALQVRNVSQMGHRRKVRHWLEPIEFIRDHMNLAEIRLDLLTWHDAAANSPQIDRCLSMIKFKYHKRCLDDQGQRWYKLSDGGLEACGAVKEGIQTFIDELQRI